MLLNFLAVLIITCLYWYVGWRVVCSLMQNKYWMPADHLDYLVLAVWPVCVGLWWVGGALWRYRRRRASFGRGRRRT